MIICHNNNIAFGMKRVGEDSDLYYIDKYNISSYKQVTYLRRDFSIPAGFTNRLKLKEYDAWMKRFECYRKQADLLSKKEPEEIIIIDSAPINKSKKKKEEKLSITNQIDLLDMIAEVESEQKNQE